MERKKSQILFNFLPDDTFNHARNGTIGKVSWIFEDRQSPVDDLPVPYILRRIRPKISRWENDVPLSASEVNLVSPDDVKFEIFPTVFECRVCSACTPFDEDRIEQGRPPYCDNCDRRLTDTEQLQFVLICPCGAIDSISLPRCNSCSGRNVRFRRPTSRMQDAYWECLDCNQHIGHAYDHIDRCRYCGNNRKIKVHSSSTTFYPQLSKFVNINDEDIDILQDSTAYQVQVIADYLLDEGSDGSNIEIDEAVLEQLDVSEEEYRQAQQEAQADIEERRNNLEEWAEDAFGDDDRRQVSEELFEYQSLVDDGDSDIDATTLEALQDSASQRADLDPALVDDFLDARDALRFSEVRLITDFPITTVVYGYSRTEAEPDDGVHLNTFHGEGGGDRMFAMTAKAEAVMFSLDPDAVIDWLDANDVLQERPNKDTEQWLLERLRQYPYFREVDPMDDGPAARYILTLLHTLSHLVINGVDALSGYSKSSLIEYLLPHTLSFVVYKHTDTDYSLGAMHTLVEKRFRELADYIQNEGDVCIYDPVCEHEENAACEDCLYISNIACDNGNHNLSRSTLYGGEFDGTTIDGFLDV